MLSTAPARIPSRASGIHISHFLGVACGMERILGRADNPVGKVLNYTSQHFTSHLQMIYLHTFIGKTAGSYTALKGFFAGYDSECFEKAAELSLSVNFELLEKQLNKVVVYLDPDEFKSTWLGNKSIYRTRMAMANDGELIILAPGLKEFGEDKEIDRLIRKYGYRTTPEIMELVKNNADLRDNLSATAHLIHGSSENRFKVTYCPGSLTRSEIEGVNFRFADLMEMSEKYNPGKLQNGFNDLDGEKIFFISNPALGLWASKNRFNN
ncbi:MAG: hypothetical protein WCI92_20065 [Bacteroidota bacterium]